MQLSKDDGIEFLGFTIFKEHKVPRARAVENFKSTIRLITRRQRPATLQEIIKELNPVVRGWGNYFKIGNVNWLYKGLDGWMRMRLRSYLEKKKSYEANRRLENRYFSEAGLCTLSSLIGY